MDPKRCDWVNESEIYKKYHDYEWGYAVRNANKLFEILMLEMFQSGLSWLIVLKKRDFFRQVCDNFDPYKIAQYDNNKINQLLLDNKIIRNQKKILALITNAKAYINLTIIEGGFNTYIWNFVNNMPIINNWDHVNQIPKTTVISDALSNSLKMYGFKFIGSQTCYAFMQAAGLVNDHINSCFIKNKIIN